MAQFRATIQGRGGEVSRLGHKKTGIAVVVNGWDSGILVEAAFDKVLDRDVFQIFATSGSKRTALDKPIGHVVGRQFFPAE